jgi:asparagine N-glycosylation enzyme membrane subunit Stt3
MVFPTFAFPLSFVTIPVIILGTYKLKFNGLVLLIFAVLYFLAISFASYAMQGQLWSRHFLVFLAPVSILLGYGLILIYDKVVKYQIFKNKLKFLLKYKILIYIISILITVAGIQVKASFWERESSYFYEFGKKIKNITNENDVIIYAYTMQDLWCATKRKSISDIAFFNPQTMNRINEEIKKYNATYLFIDTSNHIYQRPSVPDNNIDSIIELFYSSLKLKLILKDEINRYYFYKII